MSSPSHIDVPIYSATDAARYIRVPPSTLRSWLTDRGGLISPAGADGALSFANLAEAFVLSSIRRVHKVPMQRVRPACEYVQKALGVDRPLIHARFKTDGVDLFVERFGSVLNVTKQGQAYLGGVMREYLDRVEYADEAVDALYPFIRAFPGSQPRTVKIDPRCGFGRPVIAETGIQTSIVSDRYLAGESVDALAEDYDIPQDRIEDAIRAEVREAA